jgi:hypothetical protein
VVKNSKGIYLTFFSPKNNSKGMSTPIVFSFLFFSFFSFFFFKTYSNNFLDIALEKKNKVKSLVILSVRGGEEEPGVSLEVIPRKLQVIEKRTPQSTYI